jgi:lipopolysaccharide transport system ATP-binding protein
MTDVAIRCEGLAKQYRIGERESYKALRDVIADAFASPFRLCRSTLRHSPNGSVGVEKPNIWALNDVSFEIKRGGVVGIIGRNGAGKSTLLKILSRITEPTHGHADIWGRVGSLLEVGTGFHPELTGRDNIFLNGAILGMRRAEVARKFDEIVAFAEVEKFIDTPVKRYSSGMYVRLAFAVAAHMETEILLVDEVLAVGDAQFQKKCFEKFRQISTGGRTILFVSHNLAALRTVCQEGIVLDHGGVTELGEIDKVADHYLGSIQSDRFSNGAETASFVVEEIYIRSADGSVIKTFDNVKVRIRVKAKTHIVDPGLYIGLLTLDNQRIAALDLKDFQTVAALSPGDSVEMGFDISALPILAGTYEMEVFLKDLGHHKIELVPQRLRFDVVESPIYGGRKIDAWYGQVGLRACAFSQAAPLVSLNR